MRNLINSNQDPPVDLYHLEGSDKGDNKIDSLTKEPLDTLLMGDEVISTTLERENDKFIKSSVDDLVPIPRELEVTSVYDDLECDMPITISFPTTDVIEEDFDINSPLGEYVVDFLMENEDVAGLPRHLVKQLFSHLVKNLSLTKGMSDEPLGDDSKPRSYDVTFSNPLFNFNDDSTLCYDNPLFDEEFEDIISTARINAAAEVNADYGKILSASVMYSPNQSWMGLPEFVDDTVTDYSRPTPSIDVSKDIKFGDSYKAPLEETCKHVTGEGSAKKKGRTVDITVEDMQKQRNDVKARTTLLLALPDEHQLRFNKYDNAKELWEAILKTFGGNEATKKTKKNQLKQQYGNFKAEGSETLEQTFNRLQAIVSHLEFMDVPI
ncbi:hypothetical protein Tco_0758016 [Tanacetum coccineum]